jgi:hypothetical protein
MRTCLHILGAAFTWTLLWVVFDAAHARDQEPELAAMRPVGIRACRGSSIPVSQAWLPAVPHELRSRLARDLEEFVFLNRTQDWGRVRDRLSGAQGFQYGWRRTRDVGAQLRTAQRINVLTFVPEHCQTSTIYADAPLVERVWNVGGLVTVATPSGPETRRGGTFLYVDDGAWRFSSIYTLPDSPTDR